MRGSWLTLVDAVLRPARPELERCLREREAHLAARRALAEQQGRARADCEARIESARALVLAAEDGVVSSRMIELEREWRRLSRSDPDGGLMDLWARVAPPSWLERKYWRDSPQAARLDVAIALAADWQGVNAAERAIDSLRGALAAWGTAVGARTRWCPFDQDSDLGEEWLAAPRRAAITVLSARGAEAIALERARQIEREVDDAARARFPERPLLARGLARAAFVDYLFHAASLEARPNPVTALRELWATGYALSSIDVNVVIVEVPSLQLDRKCDSR